MCGFTCHGACVEVREELCGDSSPHPFVSSGNELKFVRCEGHIPLYVEPSLWLLNFPLIRFSECSFLVKDIYVGVLGYCQRQLSGTLVGCRSTTRPTGP